MSKSTWMAGCLVALAAMASSQAETVTLKTRYEPGTYVMTTKTDMDNITTMPTGETMDQKITVMMVAEMEVSQRAADGTQTIRVTFKRVAQSVAGAGMAMAYDSANPASGDRMLATGLTAMLEHPMAVTMDANDKVVSVSGMDEIWDSMAAENPHMAQMARGMKEQFSDSYVSEMVDWSSNMMPSAPVAVGDSWNTERSLTIPMLGDLAAKQKCTLKEIKSTPAGQVAVIAFTSTMEKDQAQSPQTAAPMPMTVSNIKIGQTGTMEMLLDSGMPQSFLAHQKMSMNMSVTPPAGPGEAPEMETMNMAMQQSGKIEMTIRKGKYAPPATAPATPPAPGGPSY